VRRYRDKPRCILDQNALHSFRHLSASAFALPSASVTMIERGAIKNERDYALGKRFEHATWQKGFIGCPVISHLPTLT